MPPAAITTDQPASVAAALVGDLERELKFVLPASRADMARRWIEALCVRDPKFPDADVSTVYYDTPALAALDEKLNSDYLKTKVRVRWYAEPGRGAAGPAFVELKRRIGSRREKIRARLDVPAEAIAGRPLDDPIFQALPRALPASAGALAGPAWQPMLELTYRRRRFVDPASGARLSLDTGIAVVRLNHRFLSARNMGPLPLAVVEVKGFEDTLPGRLQPLLALGARKQSMSKYAALLLHVRRSAF
jgi:hypothetical protein